MLTESTLEFIKGDSGLEMVENIFPTILWLLMISLVVIFHYDYFSLRGKLKEKNIGYWKFMKLWLIDLFFKNERSNEKE